MGKTSTNPDLIRKADRYIREDRITILTRTPTAITTRIQGTQPHPYYVIGDQHGYTCTCPAQHTCSHIIATEALAQQANLQNARSDNLV